MNSRISFTTILLPLILLFGFETQGQIGGQNVFKFVNLASSARITGLGGHAIAVMDDDLSLTIMNPASLNSTMHKSLSFQQSNHFADTKSGSFGYSHHYKPWDISFMGGVQYIKYGSFQLTDDFGEAKGEFDASEFAAVLGAGKALNEHYHVGMNIKYVGSSLESYQAYGLMGNVSFMYVDRVKNYIGALLFQNIGGQLTSYTGIKEPIKFEVLASFSKRLKHLPFRYSIVYHHLNRWNILYDDPNDVESSFFIEETKERSKFSTYSDNFFRHFVINGEFLLGKTENFNLRVGYNHFRRKELRLENTFSLSGFSFGFGVKIYHFKLNFGYAIYHQGGNVHHIGIGTHINEFRKKEKKVIKTGSIGELIAP